MKNLKYIITILFAALLIGSCEDESADTTFADKATAPANLSALFTITQDNSGLVTIAPHGEGVTAFEIFFGDNTADPASIAVGEKTNHVYAEGHYTVKVVGIGINGKRTELDLPLDVTFVAPIDMEVTVSTVVGNPFKINVTATATYETYFQVWFGEDESSAPEQFNEGQTISHTYANTGTYTITVIGYSGGAATTLPFTQEVTISNPLTLPITFENGGYTFSNFGNAVTTKVANPSPTGINTSANVAMQVKNAGSEVWAGSLLVLDTPITNLASMHFFKVKVWSPAVGTVFKLKLENLTDTTINYEVDAATTVANQWEELTYNFTGANYNQQYSHIVMFCNYGIVGNGDTYYFDDITQAAAGDGVALPLTFEPAADYIWNNFGNAFGSRVANPVAGGINTSAWVGKYVKNSGSETWAGIAIPMDNPISFAVMKKVKMKVWSPAAGKIVLMKFENMNPHNTGVDIEKQATTTVANAWEELTFDFTDINNANNYQQIVLFFNFNVSGTGETYYFDDVKLSN